ncbi:DNA topoisomerase IB [Labrys wisconsinensis]|uniref:DNA topoisomerase-1 n=1 Tax=Labrys wisconsinensis TaxID=425677 RepID=A0ABU0JL10_9HYPH|nr:DNA topoisomerase IB [Labrys wisconsinensis]MDQ0474986.1 DNA topoisomerase-1 [Labrys wisconsinensis]
MPLPAEFPDSAPILVRSTATAAAGALAEAVRRAGLRHVAVDALTITRRQAGKGFSYRDAAGRIVRDAGVLSRIRALAIPPAYVDVRIAEDMQAHLQAIGRDEAGRIQHRYHPDWDAVREERKVSRLAALIDALPRIRARVRHDLASARLDRTKALACAVALIDEAHIRIGCEAYARAHGSRGATTLLKHNAAVRGERIDLTFRGKGGKTVSSGMREPKLARALKRIGTLPGRRLLQFRDTDGRVRPITAADVNAYLRRVAGKPVTAKDFRLLGGSAAALEHLAAIEPAASEAARRRQLAAVMRMVAEHLANTPAVTRKSYVHAVVVDAFAGGTLAAAYRAARGARLRRRVENALGRLVSMR